MNKKVKKNILDKKTITNQILAVFNHEPRKLFNYKQVASAMLAKNSEEKLVIAEILNELNNQNLLEEVTHGRYRLKPTRREINGKIEITQGGYGFVVTDALEEDVFVSQRNLNRALNGDLVSVLLYARKKQSRPEGEVIEILERGRLTFVGNIEILDRYAFFVADSRKMPYDVFIPLEQLNGALNGQKVVAKITDWPKKAKNPIGKVEEVLGNPGEHETEMHAILSEYGLPYSFTEEIESAAASIPDTISEKDIQERRDFRRITTFTIDPDDAKDFDDALSIEKLPNNCWEVGIHIADVTHYIKPKTLLDEEALRRATSVYLVDRVVPMLPERLSNHLCSLRPKEEKLCFSAVFEIDEDANILDEWFGKTIIYSDRRFTYAEAQEIIDTKKGDFAEEMLQLNRLAQTLRKKRFMNGSISFERDEVKFEIDQNGKPIRIMFRQHGLSNELVEEFMLLANKQVANLIGNPSDKKDKKTFVYRIHDKPDPEKLEKFNRILSRFGHRILMNNAANISRTLNQVLLDVKDKPEKDLVETLAIRSMAKAVYSTSNVGHYGLSFEYYTHFTSPIRRYPDMMVHRLLHQYMQGAHSKNKIEYEGYCKQSSEMEQLAAEAERASIKYKQVEFMQDKVGTEFNGIISGVSEYGIFVEIIENKCEGLVAIRELVDDFYEYDDENYWLIGRHSGKVYQLGQKVVVEILRANLVRKQLDFALVELAAKKVR